MRVKQLFFYFFCFILISNLTTALPIGSESCIGFNGGDCNEDIISGTNESDNISLGVNVTETINSPSSGGSSGSSSSSFVIQNITEEELVEDIIIMPSEENDVTTPIIEPDLKEDNIVMDKLEPIKKISENKIWNVIKFVIFMIWAVIIFFLCWATICLIQSLKRMIKQNKKTKPKTILPNTTQFKNIKIKDLTEDFQIIKETIYFEDNKIKNSIKNYENYYTNK